MSEMQVTLAVCRKQLAVAVTQGMRHELSHLREDRQAVGSAS
jgi:hypothetical protein